MKNGRYTLIGVPGYGSAIVEAALQLSGLPHTCQDIDPGELGPGSSRLAAINPLGQVPTLVMPNGEAMTESAAIILHLNDRAPQAGLAPPSDDATRPPFLHWLLFLVAGIYPTFTFGDDPKRWVSDSESETQLRQRTDRQREDLWQFVESRIAPDPWFLGQRFSALDIYMTVMSHWRPRREWFAEHCPKLDGVARTGLAMPELQMVWERNKLGS